MISLSEFRELHHAVALLGMSGVGKTMLSTALRRSANWFHYSADYRIGTRYLAEDILDNVKFKIMQMRDPFVANLLRSDSIYINHNISVDNLEPVSTFLGMFGDPALGGLAKALFLKRQELYRRAEVASMIDAGGFMSKSWQIYGCKHFINDASGSLCEIADPNDADDPVIAALTADSLILYIQPNAAYEEELKVRARTHPKPLFYNPAFIEPHLEAKPDDGAGVDPLDFARPLFPDLLEFRKPRYGAMADNFGFTIHADELFQPDDHGDTLPDADRFLDKIYSVISEQAAAAETAANNLARYLDACGQRQARRDA